MWQPRCALCTALILVGLLRPGLAVAVAKEMCGPGLATPGVTIPMGDIVIREGNPLEIFCKLNPPRNASESWTSAHLVFYHNDRQVPAEFTSVVNETTIRLFVKTPPAMKSMYYCKLQSNGASTTTEESVCLNTVFVGTAPEPVINFTCVSHNWENLTCTWKEPPNYVKTTYTLRYRLPGRAGGRILYSCPNNRDKEESQCFWDFSTDPHYRQPYEYYYFTMTGENVLGTVQFPVIKFHHYSHVIPKAPDNLVKVNQTLDSVGLEWIVPYPIAIFPPGVTHWVRYQSTWDTSDHWEEVNTAHMSTKSTTPNHTRFLNVTGLKYANTLYDIKVSMKSAYATKGPEMWSIPANLTFKTLPTIPGAAPKTDIGSFETTGGSTVRDIYVYWQHIPETIKNGDNFEYRVFKMEHGEKILQEPQESTKAYSKFKLDFGGHRFIIHSANKEGLSRDQAVVYVPPHNDRILEPVSFTKIAYGNGTYELSWGAPPPRVVTGGLNYTIDNYTLFWCENDRDRPYQCSGLLNWTHVSGDKTVTRLEVAEDKIYQFAISANAKHGSSGMHWSACTVIHDKVVGKMKSVWINSIGAKHIVVGWKLECSDRVAMVTGYRIFYCPIYGPRSTTCKEPEKNVTIPGDAATTSGHLNDLKPYTTYSVAVAVETKNGVSMMSEPLYNTTLEAAPDTPPTNINVTVVTNSSMVVSWDLPSQSNGMIHDVYIYYNEKIAKVPSAQNKGPYTLFGLDSYVKYNVSVAACTKQCSNRSVTISRRTLVGVPGLMGPPFVQLYNNSELEVEWLPPVPSAGDLNYYDILVLQGDANANTTHYFNNTTSNATRVPIKDCTSIEGENLNYMVRVRAVNLDERNNSYVGLWSPPGRATCRSSAHSRSTMVIFYVAGFLLLTGAVLLTAYCLKRGWQRCKVMQDVEVKLPPGLAPLNEKDPHITVHSWPMSEVRGDPHKARPSADEELLLQKKEDRERHGRNPSGDSSGCSSGHESVSSSITAATHMSSDSGTGQDQRAGSPDGVFSESPAWECGSLDQAPVEPDPYVRMGKISGGSVARSTPNLSDLGEPGAYLGTWSSTGYISMPSSEDMGVASSSYVRVGQNPPTPATAGYITIASVQPPAPSYRPKAYVAIPAARTEADSYCRMGLPAAKIATGYVALADANATNGNYVPHGDHNSVTSV